jgi:hypothetical protein
MFSTMDSQILQYVLNSTLLTQYAGVPAWYHVHRILRRLRSVAGLSRCTLPPHAPVSFLPHL